MVYNKDNEIYYSSVSIWDIELKNISRPDAINVSGKEVMTFCEKSNFVNLPFKDSHAIELRNLRRDDNAPRHKDPFDRMLICQVISERMFLFTHDKLSVDYQCGNVVCV